MVSSDSTLGVCRHGRPSTRVAINALPITFGGGIVSARNLVGILPRLEPCWDFTLFCSHPEVVPPDLASNLTVIHKPDLQRRLKRWTWEQIVLPFAVSSYDLLLCYGGFTSFASSVPQISVWHDPNTTATLSLPWTVREAINNRLKRAMQGLSIRKATLNVFQTEHSLDAARRLWAIADDACSINPCGLDRDRVMKGPRKPRRERADFGLSVGATYFHKNYESLIDAVAIYNRIYQQMLEIKIVGDIPCRRYHDSLLQRVERLGLSRSVEFLGLLDAERLRTLYQNATFYVTTSLLETFGLTTIEAMANGLPVITSRASCMPEVCGDAALYCDPSRPAEIAAQIHRLRTDDSVWDNLSARGEVHSKRFSWSRTGLLYIRQLRRILIDATLRTPSTGLMPHRLYRRDRAATVARVGQRAHVDRRGTGSR